MPDNEPEPTLIVGIWKAITIVILIYSNYMNYIDRYLPGGIVKEIKAEWKLNDKLLGLTQTAFFATYTLSAALFGFLGDRYSRKLLLASGIIEWCLSNVATSFSPTYWAYIIFRCLFGMGQACYTTVAPCVACDLLVGNQRSMFLVVFYIAIPAGTGLGVAVASLVLKLEKGWRWVYRATVPPNVLSILAILLLLKEPSRGQIEGSVNLKKTSFWDDLKYIFTNPSFMFSTLGFTFVAFMTGAVSLWGAHLNYLGLEILGYKTHHNYDKKNETALFGMIMTLSGFFGVTIGYLLTFKFKQQHPFVNPLVCGIGLLISVPLLIASTYASTQNRILNYNLVFVGLVLMNLNWAISIDILFDVVVPSRRSTAVGIQLLVGHTLGDIGSPYYTGLLSDKLRESGHSEFKALQYGYFLPLVSGFVGALFYLLNTVYYDRDMKKMKKDMELMEQGRS